MKGDMLRHKMPAQAPEERITNFREVALGFTPELALAESERCLNCKAAPCMQGCPVGVHIPLFISRVREGDLDSAAKVLLADNNLPAVCGRVCPQENQCEKYCIRREKLGGSVAIGSLERFVADHANEKGIAPVAPERGSARVAVVGTGPASLSCAADLAKAGVAVVMFEALHKAGGVLVYGIPEFRLPKTVVAKEVEKLVALGVEIRTDMVVGKTVLLDELLAEYDAGTRVIAGAERTFAPLFGHLWKKREPDWRELESKFDEACRLQELAGRLAPEPEKKQALLEAQELLLKSGLEVDDFGSGAVAVRAVPGDIEEHDVQNLVIEVANRLMANPNDTMSEKTEWVLHSIACRAAIKAGDKTPPEQLLHLARRVLDGEIPPFCPHGRPVVLKITQKELEKQFGRQG